MDLEKKDWETDELIYNATIEKEFEAIYRGKGEVWNSLERMTL